MTALTSADDFWAALEAPLDEKPLFFIEPKDRDPASEYDRQRRFVNHMRRHCYNCFVAAIPNGMKGSDWERLRKASEGMVAGFPDLGVFWNHGVFLPEFKDGTRMPSRSQIETLNRLHRMGFRVGVYRTAETLLQHLADAGAPVVGIRG
jgi:hypothetical protein